MFGKRTASAAAQAAPRPAVAPEPGLAQAAARRPALEPVDAFSPEELDPLTPTVSKRPDPFEHALGQQDQKTHPAAGGAGPRATAGLAQLKNAQAVAEIVREQSDYYHATKTTIFNALMNTIELAQLAQLDSRGYFATGEDCLTATEGLFVAGDCRSKTIRQVVTASADGAIAAMAACRYLD